MIEINLLPGAAKRSRRRGGRGVGLPGKLKAVKLPEFDRLLGFAVAMWLVVPALTLWLFLGQRSALAETQAELDAQVADSTNLSAVYVQVQELDSIKREVAERVAIIEEIDQARYNWAHILDEVSRAVPDYLWLDNITDVPLGTDPLQPTFSIAGKAANMYAVTAFIQNLSASPFIGNVEFLSSEQVTENDKQVYSFTVQGSYEPPPPDVITVEPFLSADEGF